jgi:transcription antitermination factor NusG
MPGFSNSLPWYAIRVRPRFEFQIGESIKAKGLTTFVPSYPARRRWSDRVKEIQVPLFDGYVFCQLDIAARLPVLLTPGVLHFVGVGKTPVAIEDSEIDVVHRVAGSGSPAKPWPFLRDGDRVRVDEGPLRSMEGILLRSEPQDYVVVSITLLQRSLAVRVDRSWLTPIRPWLRHTPGRCA